LSDLVLIVRTLGLLTEKIGTKSQKWVKRKKNKRNFKRNNLPE